MLFLPDNKTLAFPGRNNDVVLYDTDKGAPVRLLKGHTRDVLRLSLSRDGKTLVSASWDGTVKLWGLSP